MTTKPLVKWVGGKSNIVSSIIEKFPSKINNYHEPFIGSGSVLFAFLDAVENNTIDFHGFIYISDKNPLLIEMYRSIKDNPDELIQYFTTLQDEYMNTKTKKEYYYKQRNRFNGLTEEEMSSSQKSALFIFINKTCFRGLYRLNSKNEFNVPFGNYSNPKFPKNEEIQKISDKLQNAYIYNCDFSEAFTRIKENDVIYIDPPYVPLNRTSFTAYTNDGFNEEKHKNLFENCHSMNTIATLIISNSDTEWIRNNFHNYIIYTIDVKRAIHSKNPGSSVNEVIITNNI